MSSWVAVFSRGGTPSEAAAVTLSSRTGEGMAACSFSGPDLLLVFMDSPSFSVIGPASGAGSGTSASLPARTSFRKSQSERCRLATSPCTVCRAWSSRSSSGSLARLPAPQQQRAAASLPMVTEPSWFTSRRSNTACTSRSSDPLEGSKRMPISLFEKPCLSSCLAQVFMGMFAKASRMWPYSWQQRTRKSSSTHAGAKRCTPFMNSWALSSPSPLLSMRSKSWTISGSMRPSGISASVNLAFDSMASDSKPFVTSSAKALFNACRMLW
mmetsp:Transcript_48112/g.138155  ORF Transcript_48112/g.138155 Transcript_48112/m.138155 type:complete len:269 (+) Transcript_48112:3-809(+)